MAETEEAFFKGSEISPIQDDGPFTAPMTLVRGHQFIPSESRRYIIIG